MIERSESILSKVLPNDWRTLVYPPLGILLCLVTWHVACIVFKIPTIVLPTPKEVWDAFIGRWDLLLAEGWVTAKETLYGFVLAIVIGIPIAVAVANSRTLNLMFYPLLVALQSVPKVALAPIVLVWLGTGIESKLAIAWLVAFFPIIVDTSAGLQSTPRELLELARSLKASRWQIFWKVQFPAALPFVMTGAKVAVTLAVIGAVIGEFIGSSEGLGFLLLQATSQVNTPLAFAALFALAFLGILAYLAVVAIEWLLAPWLPPPVPEH
ncbi:MAG: ABC transporter permease [Burkholderiales bacterium]